MLKRTVVQCQVADFVDKALSGFDVFERGLTASQVRMASAESWLQRHRLAQADAMALLPMSMVTVPGVPPATARLAFRLSKYLEALGPSPVADEARWKLADSADDPDRGEDLLMFGLSNLAQQDWYRAEEALEVAKVLLTAPRFSTMRALACTNLAWLSWQRGAVEKGERNWFERGGSNALRPPPAAAPNGGGAGDGHG